MREITDKKILSSINLVKDFRLSLSGRKGEEGE
jgi:hypothetical protein